MSTDVWIARIDGAAEAAAVTAVDPKLPLHGFTLGVKDNIDVAGFPTTAGCAAFAYEPTVSAPFVQRLVDAGAIVVGKTNMDQFATGLTGSRSPYGIGRSVVDPTRVSGGSSSGSAIAVASGMVRAALGTDTAGSGRVPAACNGIVGYKPTPGLLSTRGIVPACRSIDCPSLFTRTVDDSRRLLAVLAPDLRPSPLAGLAAPLRVGVPGDASLGTVHPTARAAFERTVEGLDQRAAGAEVIPVDLSEFFAVGDLLYGGAWVAERYHAVGAFIEDHRDGVLDVVARIILAARNITAAEAFGDVYRLRELSSACAAVWDSVDVLLVPTVGDVPTVEAVAADPIGTNIALGRFTTFANLLGLAGVAVPGAARADGVPFGVTVLAQGGLDHLALDVASEVTGEVRLSGDAIHPARPAASEVRLAVVGAHLQGQPLNHQLVERGGRLLQQTTTAPAYRLHALDIQPPKPGLVRVPTGGASIEVEVWAMPIAGFGSFVAAVPAPLAIGKVELRDGTSVSGFVCEPHALAGAPDITEFGGWRSYLSDQSPAAPSAEVTVPS